MNILLKKKSLHTCVNAIVEKRLLDNGLKNCIKPQNYFVIILCLYNI